MSHRPVSRVQLPSWDSKNDATWNARAALAEATLRGVTESTIVPQQMKAETRPMGQKTPPTALPNASKKFTRRRSIDKGHAISLSTEESKATFKSVVAESEQKLARHKEATNAAEDFLSSRACYRRGGKPAPPKYKSKRRASISEGIAPMARPPPPAQQPRRSRSRSPSPKSTSRHQTGGRDITAAIEALDASLIAKSEEEEETDTRGGRERSLSHGEAEELVLLREWDTLSPEAKVESS